MIKTSIIILTYNSEKYIDKLINSIFEFNREEEFEIIVVDNKSSDKTVAAAKKFRDKIKVFETGANLGFAKGINYGAKKASGEYLLFLNPDAMWNSGSLSDFYKVFFRSERIGIVGGRLVSHNGRDEKSAGKFFGLTQTVAITAGLDELLGVRVAPKKTQRVDFVSGGFMMVKAEIFKKLHGFDENLFMYIEDMELCYRALAHGVLTYFTPDVSAIHEGQGSSNRSFAVQNIFKGILYFHKKNGNKISYNLIYMLFKLKSRSLVLIGKMLNNRYLVDTYRDVV